MNPIFRTCRITAERFVVSPLEQELCRKFEVPPPTICPEERLRRLTAFNNFTNLYRGTCKGSGEKILQIFHPSAPFPVYSVPYWWSEQWNALDYGVGCDFKRSFFAQLKELRDRLPQAALQTNYTAIENCDYINGANYCKNCYLVFNSTNSQDCYFCLSLWNCRDCIDSSSCVDSELCYDCTIVYSCYELRRSFNCTNCRESSFLWNCIGCSECFACAGLRHTKHCFMNQKLTPEEYRNKISAIEWDNPEVVNLHLL